MQSYTGTFGDGSEHTPENKLVKGIEQIPVDQARESVGLKTGEQLQFCPSNSVWAQAQIEDGSAGHFHLRLELQVVGGRSDEHPPEIDCIPHAQLAGLAAAAGQPHPPGQAIQ